MNKRTGEFPTEECANRCSKKPKLNKDVNLISIPELKLGGDWNVHRACLENYFSSQKIDDDLRKISILIASLKKEDYQTMLGLCKPELPNQKTFKQLCGIMKKHYSKVLVFKRRRDFGCLKQFSSETVTQWFNRVKEVAAQCNFGEQFDKRVKDQFVTGMEEGEILECVFSAGYTKSLQTIVETALKKEQELRQIEKLPEEILIRIFKNLPIADRVRVERVNKSWQEISKKSWNNVKDLEASPFIINTDILVSILIRCGKYLEKIDVKSNNYPFCVLPLVAENCPKIHSINCKIGSIYGLKKLSKICRNITELSIEEFEEGNGLDEVLGDLFSNNQQLQVIDIPNYDGNGNCLSKLPFEKITAIKISSLRQLEPKMINVIENSKSLSSFKYETSDVNVFEALASNCRNLTELDLKLNDDSQIDDLDSRLSQIFKNNEKLISIKLVNFKLMTGECFLSLAENFIEKIELYIIPNIQRNFLIQSLPNFTKLHTLEIFDDSNCVDVAKCVSLCSKLKSLAIVTEKGVNKDLNIFASSKNIERLNVSLTEDQPIIENFLEYMSCNLLELKYLDISGYYDFDLNYEFNLICKLPKLEVLDISGQSEITGSGLENFPNLRELDCSDCENLEDENLIILLKCARNLEKMDIRNCKKITNRVMLIAIEETRKRTNNILLKISIAGTKIKIDEIKEKSRLLCLM